MYSPGYSVASKVLSLYYKAFDPIAVLSSLSFLSKNIQDLDFL